MTSHQTENNSADESPDKRIQLPHPDADNITVLTRKLPNEPILPWHRFDSPWLRPDVNGAAAVVNDNEATEGMPTALVQRDVDAATEFDHSDDASDDAMQLSIFEADELDQVEATTAKPVSDEVIDKSEDASRLDESASVDLNVEGSPKNPTELG